MLNIKKNIEKKIRHLPFFKNIYLEREQLYKNQKTLISERDSLLVHLEAIALERDRLIKLLEDLPLGGSESLMTSNSSLSYLKREFAEVIFLSPQFIASNKNDFWNHLKDNKFLPLLRQVEDNLVKVNNGIDFSINRFCLCCNAKTSMTINFDNSTLVDSVPIPNWREALVCNVCQMNNRQRLIGKLIQSEVSKNPNLCLYIMEQVTPIYKWLTGTFPNLEIKGSEYLGYEFEGGVFYDGIRHEDVMNLTLAPESVDLIVSNDVFEHIPDFRKGLEECVRVLRVNGTMLLTIPFYTSHDCSEVRATFHENKLKLIKSPQYHGNPLSPDGSLVFHDFGWDLMDTFKSLGFGTVSCEFYADDRFGHLGNGLIIFRLIKQ
jgi:SAM-dependent methyltransferase